MHSEAPVWLWFLIPVLFVTFGGAIWLGVTSLLGAMSGWFALQRAFPDREEPALLDMRMQTGMMGGVSLRNCMRLEACPSGLRISVSRLLGPFQRPFFVPWSTIAVRRGKLLFGGAYRLGLGTPEVGALTLGEGTTARLAEGGRLRLPER